MPLWLKIQPFFSLLDFSRPPVTKAGWLVRLAATGLGLVLLWKHVYAATQPMLTAAPPKDIPVQEIDDYRFRIPERTRHEMFTDIATAELSERERAIKANSWNGHAWSREDDRGHYERVAVRAAAAKYKVSIPQVYLVLDEGIRNHWLAPNDEPLPATTPRLSLRNSW